MLDPKSVVPESIMPKYKHLINREADIKDMDAHMKALKMIGVPYTDDMITNAYRDAVAQAQVESDDVDGLIERYGEKVLARDFDGQKNFISEMDALVAYMQVLGTMAELKDYNPDLLEKNND